MDQLEGVAGAASDARLAGMAGAVQRFAALGPGRAGAERSGGETRARSGLSSGRVAGLIGAAQRNIHGA